MGAHSVVGVLGLGLESETMEHVVRGWQLPIGPLVGGLVAEVEEEEEEHIESEVI